MSNSNQRVIMSKSCVTLVIAIILIVVSLPLITVNSTVNGNIYSILGWILAVFAGAMFRDIHYRK